MYDLIGDIHGHADELVQLLETMGYEKHARVYKHPERKVIFVGDFIDRGPKIREVLEIVRPMIEEGHALAVMGNHELNALAFHTADAASPGEFLRRHTRKNVHQHQQTLDQLSPDDLASSLEWFRTLPMWLDLEGLRVVHACWDEHDMSTISGALGGNCRLTTAFLAAACSEKGPLYAPVEVVLKGKEAPLPDGLFFHDKEGCVHTEIRTRWYLSPELQTYRTYALQSEEIPCDQIIDDSVAAEAAPYPASAKPVFVGHYWLSGDRPRVLADNVACLDYSVAKNGYLCAYRWQEEQNLNNHHFVWVSRPR